MAASRIRRTGVLAACCFLSLAAPQIVRANCLEPPGDINASLHTNVSDVQCEVLLALWLIGGGSGPAPGCLAVPVVQADINCDGTVNISDVLLIISLALNLPLAPSLDSDDNGCVDICEIDTDGDGSTDFLDCAPYNPAVHPASSEACNGWDDDCDGLIDEALAPSVTASCSDGDACNGVETCPAPPVGLGLRIHEVLIDPSTVSDTTGEWIELHNPTTAPIDINGWTLADDGTDLHLIDNGGPLGGPLMIPAGGTLLLGRSGDPTLNGGLHPSYVYTGFALNNTADQVVLRDTTGAEVDRLDYAKATHPVVAGASLALRSAALPAADAASWAASTSSWAGSTDFGTPAGPNFDIAVLPICEPGSALSCDDGVPCTADGCDPATGCTFAPADSACDDGILCTADTCDAALGCGHAPLPGLCDDGNPCTDDACVPGIGCVHAKTASPECLLAGDTFCTVSGTAGSVATCPLRLSRASFGTPKPAALQFTIGYDPSMVSPVAIQDVVCAGPNQAPPCAQADTPPAAFYPSGHSVVLAPASPSAWSGSGTVFVFNASAPETPINDVWQSLGAPAGDPVIALLQVELLTDIDPGSPAELHLADIIGATADVLAMTGAVQTGVMVLSLDGCVPPPGGCDDGVPCTVDICDPGGGCVHTPSHALCDDGHACSTGTCDAAFGCTFETDDALCGDDGNPCTLDTCVPGQGCVHVLQPGADCLPAGAACAISGAAGSMAVCPLRLARATIGMPPPASLQLRLTYDGALLRPVQLQDQVCMGAGGGPPCITAPTPPATLDPSGHSVVAVPQQFDDWASEGTVFVFHTGAPGTPITTAYAQAGAIVGSSQFVELAVELLADIDPAAPAVVVPQDIVGGTSAVEPLAGTVSAGVIIVSLVGCAGVPGSCDDGDPCTIDACDAVSGACGHAPVDCGDGDACNGLEACQPLIGCHPVPPPSCDDGAACTADACDPAVGCTHAPDHAACDDVLACTSDACAPAVGCVHTANHAVCADGISCTVDLCDTVTGCVATPDDSLCDDGAGCSTGVCDAAADCQFALDDSVCPDDGDPCTAELCVVAQGCVHAPAGAAAPGCPPDGALCALSGKADETVSCTLKVARATAATPAPTALQLGLAYDPALLIMDGAQDLVCAGPAGACALADTPPAALYPSGHLVVLAPEPAAWGGAGTVFVFHVSDPAAPLTDAWMQSAGVVGDAALLELVFTLSADVDPAAPALVTASDIIGSTAAVQPMTGIVQGGVVVLSLLDCTAAPGSCDDGDPCTADTCNPATGACAYAAATCNDADACNGPEQCVPWLGCTAAPAPSCDDGDPCTTDACHPSAGCVHGIPPDPECLPPSVLCAVAGLAGDEIACTLRLAAASPQTPLAAALQLELLFDAAQVSVAGLRDTVCAGATCVTQAVPPAALYPGGHQVALAPGAPADWTGAGSLFVFHPGDPTAPITTAVNDSGSISGDPAFLELVLVLEADIPASSPALVHPGEILGSTADVLPLSGSVQSGIILMAAVTCAGDPGDCDDGDACTLDICDGGTCAHVPDIAFDSCLPDGRFK